MAVYMIYSAFDAPGHTWRTSPRGILEAATRNAQVFGLSDRGRLRLFKET